MVTAILVITAKIASIYRILPILKIRTIATMAIIENMLAVVPIAQQFLFIDGLLRSLTLCMNMRTLRVSPTVLQEIEIRLNAP